MVVCEVQVQQARHILQNKKKLHKLFSLWNGQSPLRGGHEQAFGVFFTYFEGLVVNPLGADVVVAAVNQGHGVREAWQLGDVVLSNHQLLQFGQTQKRIVVDGLDPVGSQVDPLQLVWKVRKGLTISDHQKVSGLVGIEQPNKSFQIPFHVEEGTYS